MENYIDEEKLRKLIRETLLKEAQVVPHGSLKKSAGRARFPNIFKSISRIAKLIFTDPVSILVFLILLSYIEPEVYDDMLNFLTSPVDVFSGTSEALEDLEQATDDAANASGAQIPGATLDLSVAIVKIPLAVISDVRNAKSEFRSKMSATHPETNTILGDAVNFVIQSLRSFGRGVLDESFILLLKEENSAWKKRLSDAVNPVSHIKDQMTKHEENDSSQKARDILTILRSTPEYRSSDDDEVSVGTPFENNGNVRDAMQFSNREFIKDEILELDSRIDRLEDNQILNAFKLESERDKLLNEGLTLEQINAVVDRNSLKSLVYEIGAQEKLYDTKF